MLPATTDKVSIVMPIYNAAKYLDQCLDSIEAQTHKNLEIICINDGSTDNSLEIINKHAAADERYVVIDKENGGYGVGCNRGMDAATGQWFSVIEPDDWIEPGMYADMLAHAAKLAAKASQSGYVVVGEAEAGGAEGSAAVVDIIKTPFTNICKWDNPATQYAEPGPLADHIKTTNRIFTLKDEPWLIAVHPSVWSAIYSMDFLREFGIRFREYPGAGWADNPFLIDTMCQARGIAYLNKAYYNYRCDLPESTVGHASDEAIVRPFERWLEMMDTIERLGITDEGILAAHYMRGFNYVFGAIHDDGLTNPLVEQWARKVFDRMDPSIVFTLDFMPERRFKYFCELRDIEMPKISKMARMKYLAGQTVKAFKSGGLRMFADRVKHTVYTENKDLRG